MAEVLVPQRPDRAPGLKWRSICTPVAQPWGWSEINGGEDLPNHLSGLCEQGWHTDCALSQAPYDAPPASGACICPCHLQSHPTHNERSDPMTQTAPETPATEPAAEQPDAEQPDAGPSREPSPGAYWLDLALETEDPLSMIGAALTGILATVVKHDKGAEVDEAVSRERDQLEDLHDAAQAKIDAALLALKPSSAKLSNKVRAILEGAPVPAEDAGGAE